MRLTGPSALSRRWFLIACPVGCFAQKAAPQTAGSQTTVSQATVGRILPSAVLRYLDPLTEFLVARLTDPSVTSRLPAYYARAISRRSGFLLYTSDLTGRWEAFQMDLRNGQSKQLTDAQNLEPASLTLLADDRGFCYLDGGKLVTVNLATLRTREVYRVPEGYQPVPGCSISDDGLYAVLIEKTVEEIGADKGPQSRLRLVRMTNGSTGDLALCGGEPGGEASDALHDPLVRPRHQSVLYRCGGGVWIVNFDGQQKRELHLADGETGPAMWSPDGRSILYLNYPADHQKLHNLRGFNPDSNVDNMIANTSQFVAFGYNADASVFVGASGGKGSPHVLLLVRSVKREFTLAEHRASDPAMVSPIFTPNSQRILFASDRDGKPAIYMMSVEKLVERTTDGEETGAASP